MNIITYTYTYSIEWKKIMNNGTLLNNFNTQQHFYLQQKLNRQTQQWLKMACEKPAGSQEVRKIVESARRVGKR